MRLPMGNIWIVMKVLVKKGLGRNMGVSKIHENIGMWLKMSRVLANDLKILFTCTLAYFCVRRINVGDSI